MNNMSSNYSSDWANLPESLKVSIFEQLSPGDLLSAGLACKSWERVALHDQGVWRTVFLRDFPPPEGSPYLKASLSEVDWRQESELIINQVPCANVQTLEGHTDEVLDLAFSGDGKTIVSCAKDAQIFIWHCNLNEFSSASEEPFSLIESRQLVWISIAALSVEFSPKDTKLLVAGNISGISGSVAIFRTDYPPEGSSALTTPRSLHERRKFYMLLEVTDMYPSDILNCWFNDDYFLGGLENGTNPTVLQVYLVQADHTDLLGEHFDIETIDDELREVILSRAFQRKLCIYHPRWVNSAYFQSVFCQIAPRIDISSSDCCVQAPQANLSELHIPVYGKQDFSDAFVEELREKCAHLAYLSSSENSAIPDSVCLHRFSLDDVMHPKDVKAPEVTWNLGAKVIGLAMNIEQRFVLVNVREKTQSSEQDSTSIPKKVEVVIIDLETSNIIPMRLSGHVAFTASQSPFLLALDYSADWITSGSEDSCGYIWHRASGAIAARLVDHTALVGCVRLRPGDPQVAVTASDDNTVKVWLSKNKIKNR